MLILVTVTSYRACSIAGCFRFAIDAYSGLINHKS